MRNDDLQLLREFRADIPAPDEETRRRIYARATSERTKAHGRRWRLPALSLAACVAAGIVAVLLISPWSGSDVGLVQRALAAIGDGPVIHIVTEYPPSTVYVNLKTGRESGGTLRTETWFDRENYRYQFVETQGNRLVEDQLGTYADLPRSEAAKASQDLVALATGLRGGTAKLVGRGTFNGRPVYWLRLGLSQVGVDANTYKPILFRAPSGKRYLYTRILLAKTIAYHSADFKRRGPKHILPASTEQPAPGYAFGSTNPSTPRGTVVRAPWLTAWAHGRRSQTPGRHALHNPQDEASVLLRSTKAQVDPRARPPLRAGVTRNRTDSPDPDQRLRATTGLTGIDSLHHHLRGSRGPSHIPVEQRPRRLDRGPDRLHDRRRPHSPHALDRLPEETGPVHHDQHTARPGHSATDRPQPPHRRQIAAARISRGGRCSLEYLSAQRSLKPSWIWDSSPLPTCIPASPPRSGCATSSRRRGSPTSWG